MGVKAGLQRKAGFDNNQQQSSASQNASVVEKKEDECTYQTLLDLSHDSYKQVCTTLDMS